MCRTSIFIRRMCRFTRRTSRCRMADRLPRRTQPVERTLEHRARRCRSSTSAPSPRSWFGLAERAILLTRYSTLMVSLVLILAVAVGIVGANIIFWFVVKLLMKHDRELDPADYERVGVLGRIVSPVRAGRYRRNDLLAGRHTPHLRRPQ